MDQIVEFGKKYSSWLIGAAIVGVVGVVAAVAIKAANTDEYLDVSECMDAPTDAPEE